MAQTTKANTDSLSSSPAEAQTGGARAMTEENSNVSPGTTGQGNPQSFTPVASTELDKHKPVKFETYRLLFRTYERQREEIEGAWQMIENCYDVEPRDYFEREAKRNGFTFPLAQAIFHIHKRDPRNGEVGAVPEGRETPGEVTRFEVIDHRACLNCDTPHDRGRIFTAKPCRIELSYQDGGRTLKVFVDDPLPPAPGRSEER
jgi:hypothetical protein